MAVMVNRGILLAGFQLCHALSYVVQCIHGKRLPDNGITVRIPGQQAAGHLIVLQATADIIDEAFIRQALTVPVSLIQGTSDDPTGHIVFLLQGSPLSRAVSEYPPDLPAKHIPFYTGCQFVAGG
ncbi:hypothetical protein D3C71_1555570 [compost metagenome]